MDSLLVADRIFKLIHWDYDSIENYIVVAPPGTQPADFDKLCDALIREAANDWAEGRPMLGVKDPKVRRIDMSPLVSEVVTRLIQMHGYTLLEPISKEYCGDSITIEGWQDDSLVELLGGQEVIEKIGNHNNEVNRKNREKYAGY